MPRDPFKIDGPACVSVSGGRTSGMMLARLLDANGGSLPADALCIFANTGEEAEGTLAFVHEMGQRWGVPIRWVEFSLERNPLVSEAEWSRWREVTYCTASRRGEPFDAVVDWKQYLPNHDEKLCTEWLKVRAMSGLMRSLGFMPSKPESKGRPYVPGDYDKVIGIRADEPIRIANNAWKADVALPMNEARLCRGDVAGFWAAQPFDLSIRPGEGNCRMCFEKGLAQLENVIRDASDGGGVDRWIAREARRKALMRKGHPYAKTAARARGQLPLWEPPPDVDVATMPCVCGD